MRPEETKTETVDLTPTWREILPALLAIFENGDRRFAIDELTRMARLADIAASQVGRTR